MRAPSTSCLPIALSCLFAVGCTAEITAPPTTMPPPTMPPPTTPPPTTPPPTTPPPTTPPPGPTVVPADIAGITASSHCTSLEAGESVASVSPEGHLWLAASSSGSTSLRVLDGWDASYEGRYDLSFSAVQDLQAWTATTASLVADQALWHLEDGERIAVSFPGTLDVEASLCGDPSRSAFVYSMGALFERNGDEWFEWTGLSDAFPSAELLARDGECYGADDGVWFGAPDLEFWRLTATNIARPAALALGHHPAIRGNDVLALGEGNLFVGPEPWAEFEFELGQASLLTAAGAYAWVLAGTDLVRTDGTDFVKVEATGLGQVLEIHADATGAVWAVTTDSVCHIEPPDMVRVSGVRNGEVRTDKDLRFSVRGRAAGSTMGASVNGTALVGTPNLDGTTPFRYELQLGWQTIEVASTGVSRTIDVKLLPAVERSFETDIQPIYATHCIGCHADGVNPAAPTMATYADWVANSDKIKTRVVQRDEMPPTAARLPGWGQDQVTIIDEWLSGGLKP